MAVCMTANWCISLTKLRFSFYTGERDWKCNCTKFFLHPLSAVQPCSPATLHTDLACISSEFVLFCLSPALHPRAYLTLQPPGRWQMQEDAEGAKGWAGCWAGCAAQNREASKTKTQVCANGMGAWSKFPASRFLKSGNKSCQQPVVLHRERRPHRQPSTHCHEGKQVSVTKSSCRHEWRRRQRLCFWSWQWESLKLQAMGEESETEETWEEKETWWETEKESNFMTVKKRESRPIDKSEGKWEEHICKIQSDFMVICLSSCFPWTGREEKLCGNNRGQGTYNKMGEEPNITQPSLWSS